MSSSAEGHDSERAALVKLARDIDDLREELGRGFDNRFEIVDWLQRLSVRTVGYLSETFFLQLSEMFRTEADGNRALLSCLLTDEARPRNEVDPHDAQLIRHRLKAKVIAPTSAAAGRHLRDNVRSYVEVDERATRHDPIVQRWTAMRPELDELEFYQRRALGLEPTSAENYTAPAPNRWDWGGLGLLGGLASREAIIPWGDVLNLATNHEPIDQRPDFNFVTRCYEETSTARMLCSETPEDHQERALFAARFLLPAFNRGIKVLAGTATEQPDVESSPMEASQG